MKKETYLQREGLKARSYLFSLPLIAVLVVASGQTFAKTCADVPVTITIAAGTPTGGVSAMYGDGLVPYNGTDQRFQGGTMYQDGVGGVYAKFQICNGTNDLILNSANTSRYLNYDFRQRIPNAYPDPSAPFQGGIVWNGGPGVGFFNANEVYNSALYVPDANGTLQTCLGSQFSASKTFSTLVRNSVNQVGCASNPWKPVGNAPNPTSVVEVRHPDPCDWVVTALPSYVSPYGNYTVAGLVEMVKQGYLSGGQYDMPLLIKATLNQPGCTP